MYILELRMTAPPGKQQQVRGEARRLLGPTRARAGCLGGRCLQDTDDDTAMVVTEEWESWRHLESHVRSDDFRVMLGMMELSAEPPEIRIHEVSHTTGLEDLEKIRS